MRTAFDTVLDSQRVFRCLLRAASNPGKRLALPPTGVSPVETVAGTLLDHEVSVCMVGEGAQKTGEHLSLATGARVAPLEEADFAFFLGGGSGGEVLRLKRGTLEAPEEGATAVYAVDRLSGDGPPALRLSGPGVRGTATLGVEGLPDGELDAIRESRAPYPLGVDVYLVDAEGRLVGLPRSTGLGVVG